MSNTKRAISPKKAEPKKAKRERVTLASIDRKIGLIESRLATLNAYETMMDAMAESRLPTPAEAKEEKWVPKLGDWVVFNPKPQCPDAPMHPIRISEWQSGKHIHFYSDDFKTQFGWFDIYDFRPATSEEIYAHQLKMQEAAKKAAEEAELAKPIAFGTPVELKVTSAKGFAMGNTPDYNDRWHLAIDPKGSAYHEVVVSRHEFTVLTD